jgi:hypothetical protein
MLKTEKRVNGILIAVFSAFLNHRERVSINTTIAILCKRFTISIFVASFAVIHSS